MIEKRLGEETQRRDQEVTEEGDLVETKKRLSEDTEKTRKRLKKDSTKAETSRVYVESTLWIDRAFVW